MGKTKKIKGIIYISGPMSSKKELNYQMFELAEKRYVDKGFKVINPIKFKHSNGKNFKFFIEFYKKKKWIVDDYNWIRCIIRDLNIMRQKKITHILMLPDWKQSKGAVIEHYIASKFLQAKVLYWKSNFSYKL